MDFLCHDLSPSLKEQKTHHHAVSTTARALLPPDGTERASCAMNNSSYVSMTDDYKTTRLLTLGLCGQKVSELFIERPHRCN